MLKWIILALYVLLPINSAQAGSFGSIPCINVIADGDSITLGTFGGTNNPYPQNIASALGSSANNLGINGIGWNRDPGGGSMITLAPTNLDPLLASFGSCRAPYLILFAGVNDLASGGNTPAQAYSFFQTFISARLTFGWQANRIIIVMMLPTSAVTDANRVSYNNLLIGGQATYGYNLARTDLDSNMGCALCYQNRTFYQADNVHPTNTGYQALANIFCSVMSKPHGEQCPAY